MGEFFDTDPITYAEVGPRFHIVNAEPAYKGQPEVGLCATVFVRNDPQPETGARCLLCWMREVDRLRHNAEQLEDRANEIALSLRGR